jgi:hypothetical protein
MLRSYLLAILWTCAIFAACSIPGSNIPDIDFNLFEEDKLAHFSFFLIFGWLWARAIPRTFSAGFACIGLTGIIYGIGIEIYQGALLLHRSSDPLDAIADILGILTALIACAWRYPTKS